MTEGQRDMTELLLQLQATDALMKLTARLRSGPVIVPCYFCGQPVRQDAHACDVCGWKVAV